MQMQCSYMQFSKPKIIEKERDARIRDKRRLRASCDLTIAHPISSTTFYHAEGTLSLGTQRGSQPPHLERSTVDGHI